MYKIDYEYEFEKMKFNFINIRLKNIIHSQ